MEHFCPETVVVAWAVAQAVVGLLIGAVLLYGVVRLLLGGLNSYFDSL